MDLSEHKIIFVGGLHRSGTTVLARCLGRHPDASGFVDTGAKMDEGQWLQDVYPRDDTFGGPGLMAFDPDAHFTGGEPWASPAARDKLLGQWAAHWDLSKTYLVEKTPANILMAPFLRKLSPDSHLVFITRHPLVAAMATHRWAEVSLPVMIEHWLRAHEIMIEDLRAMKNFVIVKYEAFVEDPQAVFDSVCRQVGLAPAPLGETVAGGINRGYEALLHDGGKGAHLHGPKPDGFAARHMRSLAKRWTRYLRRRGFTVDRLPAEKRYLDLLYGERIARWGYRMDDLSRTDYPLLTPETLPSLPAARPAR